jgi:hypothetical protein
MRGSDERSGSLFSYVNLEARVRVDHPLGVIGDLANAAPRLGELSEEFGKLYKDFGRPSIARRNCFGRYRRSMGFVRNGI